MRRILIADDEPSVRDVLRNLMEDEGYEVSEAGSGDEVLAALSTPGNGSPDLVIMDVYMPGKSGLDVLREVRKGTGQAAGAQLPVLVITGRGTSKTAIEAIQRGAYDYITKPFDIDDVAV